MRITVCRVIQQLLKQQHTETMNKPSALLRTWARSSRTTWTSTARYNRVAKHRQVRKLWLPDEFILCWF